MPESVFVVVTAAGKSERFGGVKKECLPLRADGAESSPSVLDGALSPFLEMPGLAALVVTAPAGREAEVRAAIAPATRAALEARLGPRFVVVSGGPTRRDSVRLGLEAIAASHGTGAGALRDAIVLVHDGARPWASAALANRVAEAARKHGAAVPVTPLVDTPKEIGPDGAIVRHPSRASLAGAQTPQGFRFGAFLDAHRQAASEGLDCTDDAELWNRYVGPVASLPGEPENKKITYREDLPDGTQRANVGAPFRIGSGWDLHRLVPGRPLVLGGVAVPFELGEEGHSDGDVLLHAAIDALLGAAALGDIGLHFPPSDERWRGADSRELARKAVALVRQAGWEPGNLDCTVVLERPKLGPHRDAIRASMASCLGMRPDAVSVKAKTKEGVDAVGEGRAVEAYATVALFPRD
jgi:2-C-methyl-D-erythritol 4-phosphate cytidylyltransferase/2-C-methyl-D-erythritol 2,4-cyclodiphosphate synthase